MDANSIKCLVNSISRFIHLVASLKLKAALNLKNYENIGSSLKLLKQILDNILEYEVASDKKLCREYEELDVAVNNAREFMEKWSPKMSKIYSLIQSNSLLRRIQRSSLKICGILCGFSDSLTSVLHLTDLQHCVRELQCLKLEILLEHIPDAVRSQKEEKNPCPEHLMIAIESVNLTSSKELLRETIALEKERMKALDSKKKEELDEIDRIIHLLSCVQDFLVNYKSFKTINGVAIPPYFRCPLSLELMVDPVIVASGQTYERASIQSWLDHGLTACPSNRQTLSHTNLISNFTVKAMIANWCEEHKIKLSSAPERTNISVQRSSGYVPHVCVDNNPYPLHGYDSTSKSSLMVGYDFDKQKVDYFSGISEEEFNSCKNREPEKFACSCPEHSYTHSRSESASSAVSSIDCPPILTTDVSNISSKPENASETSGEITSNHPTSPLETNVGNTPLAAGQNHSSKTMGEMAANDNVSHHKALSFPSEPVSTGLTTTSHVEELVEDLKSPSNELQAAAAEEIRLLAKHNTENRIIIGRSGAIPPLILLLYSDVKLTQEHAVTALLNLSINENIKLIITEKGALDPLIHVLKTGNAGAKENAAAALFSLSVLEEYRIKIGRSDAVKALVNLLGSVTLRGRKDAATALFNLSIFHENKARIVQAGAVKYLVELMDPAMEMVDKAVALLANLSTISEGCLAIAREGGIPLLVEIIETGTPRGKENAASALLQLCISSPKYCRLVLQEGAVPPLVALSQSGTPRAKEKAQQLLSHFRNQREGFKGRRKS